MDTTTHRRGPAEEHGAGGFTLIELLVVVIIIGILAAIAIPVFLAQRERAHDSAAKSDLRNLIVAQEVVFTESGGYTDDITVLKDHTGGSTDMSPGVEHDVCTPEGDNQHYVLAAKHESSDSGFFFDNASGVIVSMGAAAASDSLEDMWPSDLSC